MKFSQKQIEFMCKIGLPLSTSGSLSDHDYILIEDKVSEHLQKHGFDKNYNTTEDGKICESILDLL